MGVFAASLCKTLDIFLHEIFFNRCNDLEKTPLSLLRREILDLEEEMVNLELLETLDPLAHLDHLDHQDLEG